MNLFNKKEKCERCGENLEIKTLTETQVQEKFNLLVEQECNFNGLVPKNEPFKNFVLVIFLMQNCYNYFECKKCGWWKFKKC